MHYGKTPYVGTEEALRFGRRIDENSRLVRNFSRQSGLPLEDAVRYVVNIDHTVDPDYEEALSRSHPRISA